MSKSSEGQFVTRRTALLGIGAGGIGAALAGSEVRAASALTTASHPLTGVWLVLSNPSRPEDPQFTSATIFAADGTASLGFVPAEIGMSGDIQYPGPAVGVWEPYDEQTGHFTTVQPIADMTGKLVGTVTVDGHPHVSEDGLTFMDTGELVTVTIRDATGAVVMVVPPGPTGRPVTATRMRVGNPGFPGEELATPTP